MTGPRLAEILDEAFDWLGPDIVLAHAKNPPYARIVDDLTTIRNSCKQNDPRMSGLDGGRDAVADRRIEQVSEIAERHEGAGPSPRWGTWSPLYRVLCSHIFRN